MSNNYKLTNKQSVIYRGSEHMDVCLDPIRCQGR